MRKELARARREPIRVMIATDPRRPVKSYLVPRSLPVLLGAGAGLLVVAAIVLGVASAQMRGSVSRLRTRVIAMARDSRVEAARCPADGALAMRDPLGLTRVSETRAGLLPHRDGRFVLESVNTAERVDVHLSGPGAEPDEASYRAVRHLLRCLRSGAESPIDPRLIELLHRIAQRTHSKIQLVSGFRAPTNPTDLNYHVRGMAADIRIPGMSAQIVRDLVRSMGVTGVGYYPTSQFVHLDLREQPYFWTDYSGPGQSSDGEGDHAPAAAANPAIAAGPPAAAASPAPGSAAIAPPRTVLLSPTQATAVSTAPPAQMAAAPARSVDATAAQPRGPAPAPAPTAATPPARAPAPAPTSQASQTQATEPAAPVAAPEGPSAPSAP